MVSFAQQFDAAGRRTRLAATVGSTTDFLTDYVYDRLGRIDTIKQQGQGGAAVATKYVDFAFDAAGQPEGLERYADSGGTQLVAETAWSFDGAGRLTGLTHAKGAATLADCRPSLSTCSQSSSSTYLLTGSRPPGLMSGVDARMLGTGLHTRRPLSPRRKSGVNELRWAERALSQ